MMAYTPVARRPDHKKRDIEAAVAWLMIRGNE